MQADVVERPDGVVGAAGQQNRAAHHGLRAVRAGAGEFGGIANELRAGEQHRLVLCVALRRGVGVRGNGVLRRGEVGLLVARELQRAAGQIDELVAIHGAPFLLFL